MPLLGVKSISKRFGGVTALSDASFEVDEASIVGIVGPNGSGKTTLLQIIMSILTPDEGTIHFKNRRIDGKRPHQIARAGIGMTFQLSRAFAKMTVMENMLVASKEGLREETYRRAGELLDFFKLNHLRNEKGANLSYGQQKLLEFARVLMLNPELILLDEPTAGVNPVLTESILNYIRELNKDGKAFIIVEHKVPVVSRLSQKVLVFDHGEKIAEGAPDEIQRDKRVIDAYLGG